MEKLNLTPVEEITSDVGETNESARTEEMHGLILRLLLEFFDGDMPISELTFDKIRKWKEWMKKNKKPNTVRGYIIKLRVVIKHLQLKGYPVINHELIIGKGNKPRLCFMDDETHKYIDELPAHFLPTV